MQWTFIIQIAQPIVISKQGAVLVTISPLIKLPIIGQLSKTASGKDYLFVFYISFCRYFVMTVCVVTMALCQWS